jgi:8-oxo-dGTP pyrophosphatase MutT (NUDIX family)
MADPHTISVTGKIFKDSKVLIVQRSWDEKYFPGKWVVPGGKLEYADYEDITPNKDGHRYNIIKHVLKREVKEEVNLEIENIQFLIDMVFLRESGIPTIIVSCTCDWVSGKVVLDEDQIDYAWVNLEEAKKYNLIDGVYDELKIAFRKKLKKEFTHDY